MSTTESDRTAPAGPTLSEVPFTLVEEAPRTLGLVDQLALWGNLGISLLGFTGAIFVLQPGGPGSPRLSLLAALTAIIVGTVAGTAAVAATGLAGAITGAPTMVLLRGLFGARVSYLPTVLNIAQLLGWGTFEIVIISTAGHQLLPRVATLVFVLVAGVATTGLAVYPLGSVRVLRKYVTVAVVIALAYLSIELFRHGVPSVPGGSWNGFFAASDTALAVAVSWVPLAADYARHSHTPRAAFAGTFLGYSVTQTLCYGLGLLALVGVAHGHAGAIFAAFLAVPAGWLAFSVLAVRELDQSFVNTYSTAVSLQNLFPRTDRRLFAVSIGALITAAAAVLNIADYENFLLLLGAVFVPMFGVFVVAFFLLGGRHSWDLTENAPPRWAMLVPWAAGFVVYQLVNPGGIGWWVRLWTRVATLVGFSHQGWMSASLLGFLTAGVVTLALRVVAPRAYAGPHPAG
ncbi:MAG: purine-cytosine permease family protein [Actinomycetes bacterium]